MDFKEIIKECIQKAKENIQKSVKQDDLVIQTVRTIEELNKTINALVKKVRDWYALYNPETEHTLKDNEIFITVILSKRKKELLKQLNIKQSMGSNLEQKDIEPILDLARAINKLFLLKKSHEIYQQQIVKEICPNMTTLTGFAISAKLIELGGGLKKLSKFPSSTIQLLGAEIALFRHLKTGAKPPKYGILHEHPLISKNKKNKGKIARALADKISIAVKVDFFKGKFVGDKLKMGLEKRFGKW